MLNLVLNSFPDSADVSGEKTIEFYVTLEEIGKLFALAISTEILKKTGIKQVESVNQLGV